MATVSDQRQGREALQMQAMRDELIMRITHALPEDGGIEPLQGLRLVRLSAPSDPIHSVFESSLCVIAQGCKEVLLGQDSYHYDPFNYVLATVDLPSIVRVVEASAEKPYLSLQVKIPPTLVASVMAESGYTAPPKRIEDIRAFDVSPLDGSLLEAVVRLVRLIDTPDDAAFFMPMITREIIYRLLKGEQANRLFHLVALEGNTPSIVLAIQRLRQEYDQSIRVEDLASDLGMSVSSFHHHFKSVTALSPLQYQKRLRLQEARRLMLGQGFDATQAAFHVGYNDASYFSREYKSLFGEPPMRDIERLRQRVEESAD